MQQALVTAVFTVDPIPLKSGNGYKIEIECLIRGKPVRLWKWFTDEKAARKVYRGNMVNI